ncbi:MAG: Stp1/IreP family PP2C-type Ser/Thr phosphatase [Clostridiales bacterium]|nr:Stp1/IreP family PP2C-type Ser/Thr phosphatase [Clostridiales bacterium]
MAFRAAGITDAGLARKENQDSLLVLPQRMVYAVADGMGGHAGGRQASAIAVEALERELGRDGAVDEARVEKALAAAGAGILKEAKEKRWDGMGTTLVLAFCVGSRWHVAHIGDSRAYVINSGGVYALTRDHSLVGELLARGSITPEEAKTHPHRNVLTRALGADGDYRPEWNEVGVEEAEYLLLCSDGLYNMVEPEKMRDVVLAPGRTPEEKAGELVEEANRRGGLDNITVILIAKEGGL